MDHRIKALSAPNLSRKRKASKPKQKGKAQEALQTLKTEGKSSKEKTSKCEEEHPQKPLKIKRTYGRKSPQGIQSVPFRPAEETTSESSCSSGVSSSLANGREDLSRPTRKLSSYLNVMEVGPSSDRAKGKNVMAKKKWRMEDKPCEESKPSNENFSKEVKQSGSQEEAWNMEIANKGRVTCPNCKTVSRKTVEGLKKHMTNCKMNPFTCQHCGKQLKSSTGMKYHLMADHNNLVKAFYSSLDTVIRYSFPVICIHFGLVCFWKPTTEDGNELDNQLVKDKLRKVLKRMGKLKCSKEGCSGSFTSVMGYLYHVRKCGKEESELEKLLLNCRHCGKAYKSKAGLEYHLKSEHGPTPEKSDDEELKAPVKPNLELTPSGRVKRTSAQVAVFHLQEIASEELLKEWPKRKVLQDLVPDDKKLKYARPGLPAFSQEVLRKWKNEVKLQRKVQCPNQGCNSVYTSVSGLKAHLGLCSRGDFEAGKYKCLICDKEFSSESGVKYHINSIHAQDWFIVSSKASKSFEKLLKAKPKEGCMRSSPDHSPSLRFTPGARGWQDKKPRGGLMSSLKTKLGQETRKKVEGKLSGREKDCYDFSGSDSPTSSSSSSSSSSSDSETEEKEALRQDKWALKRPLVRADTAKRAKNSS